MLRSEHAGVTTLALPCLDQNMAMLGVKIQGVINQCILARGRNGYAYCRLLSKIDVLPSHAFGIAPNNRDNENISTYHITCF